MKRKPGGLFYGRVRSIAALELKRNRRLKRRLREETWMCSAIRLGSMNQKRVAKINRTGVSRGQNLAPRGAFGESIRRQLFQREAFLARRRETPRNIQMRGDANPRWRVFFSGIGEKKEHQQRPAF